MKVATDIMFTQMSEKSGIKKKGKSVAEMVKEFRQIEKGSMSGKPVVTPIDPDTLSFEEKIKAL